MTVATYILAKSNPKRGAVRDAVVKEIDSRLAADEDVTVRLDDVLRTLDQNAKMWPMLTDFAKQVRWPVNGEMSLLDAADWKALLTAAFQQEARMAPGIRGGYVMLGARTSKFNKKTMADFITFLYSEGSDRDVKWSEPSREMYERYGNKPVA